MTTSISKILRKIQAIENDPTNPLKLTFAEYVQADAALRVVEATIGIPKGKRTYTPEVASAVMDWAIAFAEVP